ncbi:hypothetical protein SAMN05444007_105309 [Cribrihabitans marinus]|uniref:Excalibur calcium-binding domain-containing protein n=1 Tax=Cribrihabitans marinus TaxID=1227549 RepID=A0A1H6ZZ89_9RHOB|nr:hypothetical protein [Cribrihabitans marinus]GGH29701.1 hypothetical protein GCM10010973_19330 [Cribrihabitans marinus]SEJ58749.1 hypothetical protein SAMN05444007_105309 [Cribrihabitans marinus]
MRAVLLVSVLGLAAGCAATVPDSGQGVGFNTPEYQAQRDAALTGQTVTGEPLVPGSVVSSEELPPAGSAPLSGPAGAASAEDIAQQTARALEQSGGAGNQIQPPATAQAGAPLAETSTGISAEQDFDAVSSRRSIEGDAALIERNRAQYEVVQPTAVPERSGNSDPNIVQYALNTSHPRGTQLYSRSGFNLEAKAQRACAGYSSPDQAQIAFLSNGGPERDRKGLDPDGDGYACRWDPAPFRRAVQN